MFEAGKHDLVIPLVNALGKRTFKSDRLKDVAIQMGILARSFQGQSRHCGSDIANIPQSLLENILKD